MVYYLIRGKECNTHQCGPRAWFVNMRLFTNKWDMKTSKVTAACQHIIKIWQFINISDRFISCSSELGIYFPWYLISFSYLLELFILFDFLLKKYDRVHSMHAWLSAMRHLLGQIWLTTNTLSCSAWIKKGPMIVIYLRCSDKITRTCRLWQQ